MLWLFTLTGVYIICFEFILNKRLLNVSTILIGPYIIIILFNNIVMVKYGFFNISNETISMLTLGVLSFFFGGIIAKITEQSSIKKHVDTDKYVSYKFDSFNIDACIKYTLIIEIITWIRFFNIIINQGVYVISTDSYEGFLVSGPLGHLLLTIYPLIPIIFLGWLKNKRRWSLLALTISAIFLFFLTMVKYHAIGLVVLIFLFCIIEDKKYLKTGLVLLILLAVSIFIGNYFLIFLTRGTVFNIDISYYFNHLWNYIAGSLIYDNQIFNISIRPGTNIFYKLGSFIFAFPNMFLRRIFGFEIFPHKALIHLPLGTNGEHGNVIDAIGYLYPSKGRLSEVILWLIVLCGVGFFFTKIYNYSLKKNKHFHITLCVFLTFFVFFSFFGTFYVSPTPWEILIWSVIIPAFFDGRFRITGLKH